MIPTSIHDKRALVTGGTRGIGAATSLALAAAGFSVHAWYRENDVAAGSFLERLQALGYDVQCTAVDVTDPDAVEREASQLRQADLVPELVVHCAGAIPRPADWQTASVEATRYTIEVNLTSALWVSRSLAPLMQDQGRGHFVFLTSSYALLSGAAPVLAYTAAKAGLVAVVRGLAAELSGGGVRVNAVAPSNIDTDMTRSAGQTVVDWAVSTTPVGRLGAPEEVAKLILALHDNDYITGSIVLVDGGQTLQI